MTGPADFSPSIFQALGQFADRHARGLTIAICLIAVPAALLVLAPTALTFAAGPLDPALEQRMSEGGTSLALSFRDAEGNFLGRQGPVIGVPLHLSELPAVLPAAFLAMEDRRFYSHEGIDLLGLARAAEANFRARRYVAGGSTISQQTVKLLSADRERTLARKIRELLNTAALEQRFSKQQILETYLNRIYLGEGAHGVDTAARTYFGVSARQVTLAQAAMLAGLTRAPSVFSPRRDLAMARRRADLVLTAMVETGAITPGDAALARAHPAELIPAKRDDHNYVLDAAADEARRRLEQNGLLAGEFVVHTSIASDVQRKAETALAGIIEKIGAKLHISQGAVVVMTPDGAIIAMVGGTNYAASVFNRVTQARRQPGSAFKPFVYAAALQQGMSPWDWRDDQPVSISGYQPANYHNASYGRLQLTNALARSVNTISVNLAQEVGLSSVSAIAHRIGIVSPLHDNASLALGTDVVTPVELTAAYATFANKGARARPELVMRIDNKADGNTVYRRDPVSSVAVIADSLRQDMTAMLYDVVQAGTGTGARLGNREAAGKTGTTQANRDAWFVGFTAGHVAGVWIGNDDNSSMRNVTGGSIPAQLWKQVMLAAEGTTASIPLDRTQPPPPSELEDAYWVADMPTSDSVVIGSGVRTVYRDSNRPAPYYGEAQAEQRERRAAMAEDLYANENREFNRAQPAAPAVDTSSPQNYPNLPAAPEAYATFRQNYSNSTTSPDASRSYRQDYPSPPPPPPDNWSRWGYAPR